MQDSEIIYRGTVAAAAAAGISQGTVMNLIRWRILKTAPGGTSARGGRPPHLIRKSDLDYALAQHAEFKAGNPIRRRPPPAKRNRQRA